MSIVISTPTARIVLDPTASRALSETQQEERCREARRVACCIFQHLEKRQVLE